MYRRFAGHQAVTFRDAFLILDGGEHPDCDHPVYWDFLCELLKEMGYRQRFVRVPGSDRIEQLFVREPWPWDGGSRTGPVARDWSPVGAARLRWR